MRGSIKHPANDEQLLAAFLKGDRAALGLLAQRYEIALLGLCRGLVDGRSDLAMDAVQETWVRVIRFGDRFTGKSSFKTWLYRIAINQAANVRKSSRSQRLLETKMAAIRTNHSGAETVKQEAMNDELRKVLTVLGDLPDAQRSAVALCHHAGMTHEQAAEVLEIPVGTLKSRLHAAMKHLREKLGIETKPLVTAASTRAVESAP